MRVRILVIVTFMLTTLIVAQEINLPENAEKGKCYLKMVSPASFDYYKEYNENNMWKEASCEVVQETKPTQAQKQKYKAYQEILKKYGYDLEVTGKPTKKFILAHNRFLREQ